MAKKRRLFALDIETTKFKQIRRCKKVQIYELKPILACIIEYDIETLKEVSIDSRHSFTDIDKLIEFFHEIAIPNKFPIVYCHNLKFDSKFFFDELNNYMIDFEEKSYNINHIKAGSKIISLKCRRSYMRKGKKGFRTWIQFKDSYALLPTKLETLGQYVNLPKLKINFSKDSIEYLTEYCFRDCEIIMYAIKDFINVLNQQFNLEWNIEKLPLTIGSSAKRIFSTIYPDVFYKYNEQIEQELRNYYFGGRVEVFNQNILKDGVYLDVNSLYPYVMSKYNFGRENTVILKNKINDVDDLFEWLNSKPNILGFIAIIKETGNIPYFCECFEVSKGMKKTMFLVGIKETFIPTSVFIELYLEGKFHDGTIDFIESFKYFGSFFKKPTNFSEFFIPMYELRKSKKNAEYYNYILKRLMASLHGKLGQKPERERREILNDVKISDIRENPSIQEKNGRFFLITDYIQRFQTSHLLNACLTTAYARYELTKSIIKCENPYYCDTDSIVVNESDLNLMNKSIGDDIGQWKIEKYVKNFNAISCKEYYLINSKTKKFEIKIKGINDKTIKTADEYMNYLKKGILQQRIESITMILRRGLKAGAVSIFKKKKTSYYDKRAILPDLTTRPISKDDNIGKIIENNKLLILKKLNIKPIEILTDKQIKLIKRKLKKVTQPFRKTINYYDLPLLEVPNKLKEKMINLIINKVLEHYENRFGIDFVNNLDNFTEMDIDDGLTYYENIEVLSNQFNFRDKLNEFW